METVLTRHNWLDDQVAERDESMTDVQKTKVLLVDDLPEKLLAYQAILEDLNLDLTTARSGQDALRHILRDEFAVILLDVNMPGMDGFETADYIRKRKQSCHTPIIFMTAFADEMRTNEGYALGAVDFILTPVVPEILRAKVKVFVDLFRMSQQVQKQVEERIALAEERTKRTAAEESNRVLSFLARVGSVMGNSLDYNTTLRDVVQLPVPFLCDEATLVLAEGPNGGWRVISGKSGEDVRAAEPTATSFTDEQRVSVQRAFAANAPDLITPLAYEVEPREIVLPLRARCRTFAAVLFSRKASGRSFTSAEIAVAQNFASRAAVALDNSRLYQDVREADRQKNDFLSMLAHELRNPLAPIRNAVELLRLNVEDPKRSSWACGLIDRQVRHMVRLVDDLLDISRITQGKIRLQMEPVDLARVVADAVESSLSQIDARGHQLRVDVPDNLLWVNGDANRLEQVINNLLNNAAKYSEQEGKIHLSATAEAGFAVIRVEDEGIGIPTEMLEAIFELFTQVDRAIDRSEGGLGIGLTLVQRIVEMHGGTTQAMSKGLGSGSQFTVRIPLLAQSESPQVANNAHTASEAGSQCKRILIVDDNVDGAESLAILLRLQGHEVRSTHDGISALELSEEFCPDVVVLDIGLPRMHGYEVARRLRSKAKTQRALLVAVTGYGTDLDMSQSREAGFDHHLVKPVDLEKLGEVVGSPPTK
ncbi:MAG: response regulator [Gemmataceae bacterium]